MFNILGLSTWAFQLRLNKKSNLHRYMDILSCKFTLFVQEANRSAPINKKVTVVFVLGEYFSSKSFSAHVDHIS